MVTHEELDATHERLLNLGASCAKLRGACGGGFFLVHGDTTLRERLTAELGANHIIIPLSVDFFGSRIIHDGSE